MTNDFDSALLYQHSSELFDVRYAQKDYASEAALFSKLLDQIHPSAVTLLDVACGTGRHSEQLRSRYRIEALDVNPKMLEIAKRRLIDVPVHQADMSKFDLGRTFDVVTCFFASVSYLGSLEKLRDAIRCMAKHLSPNGVLFVEPWLTPSMYRENEVVHNIRRTPERVISWMYVMRRKGRLAIWDIHWLVGTSEHGIIHFVEREELALYTSEEIADAMRAFGLDVVHHPHGLHGYGAFLGRLRQWSSA